MTEREWKPGDKALLPVTIVSRCPDTEPWWEADVGSEEDGYRMSVRAADLIPDERRPPWWPPQPGDVAAALDTLPARFVSKVRVDPSGCWVWTAGTGRGGYARYKVDGSTIYAHRYSYAMLRGDLPDPSPAAQLDHLCRRTNCVNPWHLELVDARTNTMRGTGPSAENAAKDACRRGHPLTADNIMPSGIKAGKRMCLTCNREHGRERHEVLRAAAKHLGMSTTAYKAIYGSSRKTADAVLVLPARTREVTS